MTSIFVFILLVLLLAVTLYFLRATSAAADRGMPVRGMGGHAVREQAKEDKAAYEAKKDD